MPRRTVPSRARHIAPTLSVTHPAEDDFVQSLRTELGRTQEALLSRSGETSLDRSRSAFTQRVLTDFWEIHNQFEDTAIHLTMDPPPTLFANFQDYPKRWQFKEAFDFGGVKTPVELRDRTPGWIGFTLRFWYYVNASNHDRLRCVFEWCDGESYHKYAGWMRNMSQAILFDEPVSAADVHTFHRVLKDVVVAWYTAHLSNTAATLIQHLKEKYPPGPSTTREAYRS